jgi:hypothetical protein
MGLMLDAALEEENRSAAELDDPMRMTTDEAYELYDELLYEE